MQWKKNIGMHDKLSEDYGIWWRISKWEKTGKGKEYYFYHKLISEENYFYNRNKANSDINGKLEFLSKYSFNRECKLQFEGEYSNGEKNGKGKVYYDNGKLQFEGYFLNGLRNGSGKEYYDNGKLQFKGIFINGFIAKWKNIIKSQNLHKYMNLNIKKS